MAISGYYRPADSQGWSYVVNKKTDNGEYYYDSLNVNIGLQEQAALQQINKDYSTVIENAYSNYLSSRQGIMSSMMGQGYKEAYMANQQQAYLQGVAEANANAANARQQIVNQADEARANVQQMYQTEVANYDRAFAAMEQYYNYQKTLTSKPPKNAPEDWQATHYISQLDEGEGIAPSYDQMYDKIFGAGGESRVEGWDTVVGYQDAEDKDAMTLDQWLKNKYITGSEEDQAWWQWYQTGGRQSIAEEVYEPLVQKAVIEQEERKKAEEKKRKEINSIASIDISEYTDDRGFRRINGSNVEGTRRPAGHYNISDDTLTEAYELLSNKEPKDGTLLRYNNMIFEYQIGKSSFDTGWYKLEIKEDTNLFVPTGDKYSGVYKNR